MDLFKSELSPNALFTSETKELFVKVANGNPGAVRVINELMWFSTWDQMMRYLIREKITGSKLWELYKDKYNGSWMDLGNYLKEEVYKKPPWHGPKVIKPPGAVWEYSL